MRILFLKILLFLISGSIFAGDLPRFAVISDTHIGNRNAKAPRVLKNIFSHGDLDAIFVVGDLTDNGRDGQFAEVQATFTNPENVPPGVAVYYMMGNHDNYSNYDGNNKLLSDKPATNSYLTRLGQPLHQYIEIKGYPFITVSMTDKGEFDAAARQFLTEKLEYAAAKYPKKPIFVFYHKPPRNTCYGSRDEDGWGSGAIPSLLNDYPQVIVFSGHSHFPLGDPRSIHQGKYTAVNDGSSFYSEIEPKVVDEGIHPDKNGQVTEGVIVNILPKSGNVEMERWDTYRNEEILPRWTIKAPFDGSNFTTEYANRTGIPAPVFASGDALTVKKENDKYTFTFPAASDTADDVVHRYVLEIMDGQQQPVKTLKRFSGYYLNSEKPVKYALSIAQADISFNQTLTAQVKAIDAYGNQSLPLVSAPFVALASKPWIDCNQNGSMDVYENPDADTDSRVYDLLSQMTVKEKISILWEMPQAIPRLGISRYYHGNEALHGVVRPGWNTVFPQAIALAATWNPSLIETVATAISDEARARWNDMEHGAKQTYRSSDLLTFWSPTVNMARDPRWGRTPETYGEDPFLSSETGVAFVKGLQGYDPKYLKVVSTPKHFVANNEEHNRFSCKVEVPEYTLRNYYLRAFQALITKGKAQSIMTAYPAINGIPCTANKWLLNDVLRKEWGFNGYIVSDCGAVDHIFDGHHYAANKEDAAVDALKAGLDLECGGCMVNNLYNALQKGLVTEQEIDNAAFHLLRGRFKLGMFDDLSLVPYNSLPSSLIGCKEHQRLALETARQSIVLLKNNGILPLDARKIKSIAVLGINASTAVFGDYSGFPVNEPVSPLKGITDKFGDKIKVYGMPWRGNLSQHEIIPAGYLFHKDEQGIVKPGLKAEYFSDFKFTEKFTGTTDNQINIDLINLPPNPVVPLTKYVSAKWAGIIKPAISGDYELGIIKNGGVRLIINGEKIIEGFNLERTVQSKKFAMEAGKEYDIVVEYFNYNGGIHTRDVVPVTCISLLWKTPGQKASTMFAKEKQLARKADVAIVVMGINTGLEREGLDRKTLQLPDDQQLFIREIFKVNPKTILVLVAGSQLSVRWEQDNLPAIVNAWYPGEQGGTAIAEVLFGEYNPAARLPLTYYESLDELPTFNDYQVTNGRTYMYFKGKQLYPFGFGLSYTTFEYSDISVEKPEISAGDTIRVSVNVKNTGKHDGDEIVQLYLKSPDSRVENPVHQLKGFKRIHLKKGENGTVRFELDREALSYWNHDNNYVVERGEYELQIGASAADIRQKISFTVK